MINMRNLTERVKRLRDADRIAVVSNVDEMRELVEYAGQLETILAGAVQDLTRARYSFNYQNYAEAEQHMNAAASKLRHFE